YSPQFEQSYKKVKLIDKNGKRVEKKCHKLIWVTFNGPIPKGMEIDHINRNKFDNRLENLRLVTRSVNAANCNRTYKNEQVELLSDEFTPMEMYKEYDFSDYEVNEWSQIRKINNKELLVQHDHNLHKKVNIIDKI